MDKSLESIYKYSPIFMQNIFCSLYGFHLHRERYLGEWKECFEYLNRTQHFSAEKLHNLQVDALKKILSHAFAYVPYYREKLQISRDEIDGICSLDILLKLPVLEKETFRLSIDRFLSRRYDKRRLVKVNTSGTTGTPLTIYISRDARQRNYAFFARSKRWAGLSGFERSVTLAGRTIVPAEQKSPPFWRRNALFNNTLFSSYHLSEANLQYYVDEIRRLKPVFIDSYPSSISQIADFMLRYRISDLGVRAIITSAETLLEHQREKIEKAFGCRVYDQYGSAEQVVFACQCEKGSYHINPEYGYLEVLDGNNNRVVNGEVGDLVCTGFTNEAMPLIRYKIGDKGILGDKECACGRHFPVISKIYGRDDDLLITRDGRYVGRLDPIFKGMGSTIKETQIVQDRSDLIQIKIVRGLGYKEEHSTFLIEELRKRIGPGIHYQVQFVDSIPRTNAGKFRAVICRVQK